MAALGAKSSNFMIDKYSGQVRASVTMPSIPFSGIGIRAFNVGIVYFCIGVFKFPSYHRVSYFSLAKSQTISIVHISWHYEAVLQKSITTFAHFLGTITAGGTRI